MTQPRIQRLLIIKLGSIGDVVHTLPALATLRQAFPDAELDWLVERKARPILQGNTAIHEVIEADTHRWRKSWWAPGTWLEMKGLFQKLRARSYDVVIDFQGLWKSASMGYFSHSRKFIGFAKGALKEPGCRLFYQETISPSPQSIHVVERYLDLVRNLTDVEPVYQFELPTLQEDEASVSAQLTASRLGRFVIFNPGGGWTTKNWLPENYAKLHDMIQSDFGLRSVVTWGPGEEILVEKMINSCRSTPPVKIPTTILQFIALVRKAALFVGGDTGPLHIAAACGTPVVAIYGPTDPARNGPFGQLEWVASEKVPCGPCYLRRCTKFQNECLRKIEVEHVYRLMAGRMELMAKRGLC
ncbi:MAG: lipopolysaccharide heptosyltransferase I [Terriglobia bacterium]